MSFILDALRKSDAERQRGAAPGLADVRYATHRGRRNIWVPLLAVVVAANIGFMAWLWNDRPQGSTPVDPAELSVPVAAPAVPAEASVPEPAVRALAREATPVEPVIAPEVQSDLPEESSGAQIPERSAAIAAPVTGTSASPASKIISAPVLPSLEQLIGAGKLDLPQLNLDLLVYNDTPSVRFVVINGRKYREGTQLAEGPTLESITTDGVVLASQGQRFTLNRK